MTTNFHRLLAKALDDGDTLELACNSYRGFSLDGEPLSATDLLLLAHNSNVLTEQLFAIRNRTENMLENLDRKEVV